MPRIYIPSEDENPQDLPEMLSMCPLCEANGTPAHLYADKRTFRWVCLQCGYKCRPGGGTG